MVFSADGDEVFTANPSGASLIEAMVSPMSREALSAVLVDRFGAPEGEAQDLVHTFLEYLMGEGLAAAVEEADE